VVRPSAALSSQRGLWTREWRDDQNPLGGGGGQQSGSFMGIVAPQ
jgi:hypothetical protein